MQDGLFPPDLNGMPRIVSALEAYNESALPAEHINNFAFAFITPLGANNNCVRHGVFLFFNRDMS